MWNTPSPDEKHYNVLSRTEAKRRFCIEDHKRMAEGVECRKDADVIDETPAALQTHRGGKYQRRAITWESSTSCVKLLV